MKPIVYDLFCGLGGFSEAFIAHGYRAIGFDIEAHDYGNGGYPGELVLRDIRSLTGAELVKTYGVPTCIVASPPCQFFSYCAMPWSRAKALAEAVRADPARTAHELSLFNACFRIQREVSEAAGHYVPMVVENVRGAQRWVGRSQANFGSFYLWGDVPALMPDSKTSKGFSGFKTFKNFHDCEAARKWSSRDPRRKAWSAEIAKIPPTLARWLAKCFLPKDSDKTR